MINRIITGWTGANFTEAERSALLSLRSKYQTTHHLFTEHELAHLRFIRWLIQSPNWNRAIDQPDNAQQRHTASGQRPMWSLGFTA